MKNDENLSSTTNESEAKELSSEIDRVKQWFVEHPDRNDCKTNYGMVRRNQIQEDLTNAIYTEEILVRPRIQKKYPPFTDFKAWQSIFRIIYHERFGNTSNIFTASCVELHESTDAFRRFSGNEIHKPIGLIGEDKYEGFFLLESFHYKFENGDDCDYVLNICPESFYYEEPTIGYIKVFPFLGGVLLNSMQVNPEARGKKHGSRFLGMILDRAQKTQTKVYVRPGILENDASSLTINELRHWYARHGFVDTLPIYVPVLRLSHFRGGLTYIIKTKYMCFSPSLVDATTPRDDAAVVTPSDQTQIVTTQTIHIAKNT